MNNKRGLHVVSHDITFVVTGDYINKKCCCFFLNLTLCGSFLN